MKNKIHPCIWSNHEIKKIADFYVKTFPNAQILEENLYVVMMEINGQKLMLLNGNNQVEINPSISFMYLTPDNNLVNELWEKLLEDGTVLMEKDSYDWSKNYGWIQDKFGVSWQLILSEPQHIYQEIVPTLMFVQNKMGKSKEATEFYISIFPNSEFRGAKEDENGNVLHGEFLIENYMLMIMDAPGNHEFDFNEAVSIVVNCKNQEEIDHYWNALTANGGQESLCGWLKDKYGVSWQITPNNWSEIHQKTPMPCKL